MTAILKEEQRMETPAKTYLQSYKEHISGYKQYKLEKAKSIINRIPVQTT